MAHEKHEQHQHTAIAGIALTIGLRPSTSVARLAIDA
jgi:hypothetical protein